MPSKLANITKVVDFHCALSNFTINVNISFTNTEDSNHYIFS